MAKGYKRPPIDAVWIRGGDFYFPFPYRFDNKHWIFVCPICHEERNCGVTNSTTTMKVVAARNKEHSGRHTAEFLTLRRINVWEKPPTSSRYALRHYEPKT